MLTNESLENLYNSLAHAACEGFGSFDYDTYDFESKKYVTKKRRPRLDEIELFAMFPQYWSSTALGHGGMGGSKSTKAYTTVLKFKNTFLIYFGDYLCYKLENPNTKFFEDVKERRLVAKKHHHKYLDPEE